MSDSKRVDWLDLAKGIGLLLVIFGHTFRPSMCDAYSWCAFSYNYVYSFHVSLLFLVSGIGYALTKEKNIKTSTKEYITKKAKHILLPWFSYALCIYLVFCVCQFIPGVNRILSNSSYQLISPVEYLLDMLYNENPYCFHIWYLQTLFLFVIATYLLDKYLPRKAAFIIKIVLIVSLPLLYRLFFESSVWAIKGFFQKYLFFLLGASISPDFIKKEKGILSVAGVISLGLLSFFSLGLADSLFENQILGTLLFYVQNLIIAGACFGITAICCFVCKYTPHINKLGRNSMFYYIYHQPFCCAFLGIILFEKLNVSAALTVIICMISSIALPYVFKQFLRVTKLSVLFEKIGLPN